MRKTKTIDLEDRKVTVKELRPADIMSLMDLADDKNFDLFKDPEALVSMTLDIKYSELIEMGLSDIMKTWDGFKEVNAAFLELIGRLGITKTLGDLIKKHLDNAFAGLSNPDTSVPGSTDGVSS